MTRQSTQMLRMANRLLLRPGVASLLGTALYFVILLAVLHPRYAVSDDVRFIANLSGYMGGTPVPIMMFSNVLLGFLLASLYGLGVGINWMTWLYVALHAGSTWALLYLVVHRRSRMPLKALGVAVALSCEAYFVLNLTFTTVAAVSAIAGYCLLAVSAERQTVLRQGHLVLGSILVVLGSLVRAEAAVLVTVLLVPFVIIGRRLYSPRRLALALAACGIVGSACYGFNLWYLRQSTQWYRYYLYERAINELQDTPRIANAGRAIRDIGWTSNDLNMLARFFFPDEEVYSLEKLDYIIAHVPDMRATFSGKLPSLPLEFWRNPIFRPYTLLVVVTGMAMAFFGRKPKRVLLAFCLTFIGAFGVDVYLLWRNRVVVTVVLSSLAAAVLFALCIGTWSSWGTAPHAMEASRSRIRLEAVASVGRWATGLLLCVVLALVTQQAVEASAVGREREYDYHALVQDIERLRLKVKTRDLIIISPAFGIPLEWADPMKLDFPPFQYTGMGGYAFSPTFRHILSNYRVAPMPAGLYENANAYFMTDETTMEGVLKYIQRRHDVHVVSQLVYRPTLNTGTVYDGMRLYKLEQVP